MTIEQLLEYYKTGYSFRKNTGMSSSSWSNWKKWGRIPFESQIKIQHLTNNELLAEMPEYIERKKRKPKVK